MMKLRVYWVVVSIVIGFTAGIIKAQELPERPQPKAEPEFSKKQFLLLSSAVYAASFADMHEWIVRRPVLWEQDPLAKPFARWPASAYYAGGAAVATGVNFLSYKMGHSRRFRRFSCLPQIVSIGGNTFGFVTTLTASPQATVNLKHRKH